MGVLDILILAVLLVGLVKGAMDGFFRQTVSTVGFFAGLLLAFMLYSALGEWLAPLVGGDVTFGRGLAFVLIWLGIPAALSFVAFVLTKAAETVHLGGLNRLGGALLGGVKYLLFLSCALNVASSLHLVPASAIGTSRFYGPVHAVAGVAFDACKPHVDRVVKRMVPPDGRTD